MDPQFSLQDVNRCELCETAKADGYCDLCHLSLCKPCIGGHVLDEYDNHKVVPFRQRNSTLIYPKCKTHPPKICDIQCKDCNIFVCSSCLTSELHNGHIFLEILEAYKTKKEIVEKDFKKLEFLISPSYEETVLDLEKQLASLDNGYENLTLEVSKQGEKWHGEIDVVINKMKNEITEIKMKHNDILQKYLDEVKNTHSRIKHRLAALKAVEKSTEVSTTIEYNSEIKEFSKLPRMIKVCLPTFIKKPIDPVKLYSFFGEIIPLSTDTEEDFLLKKEQDTSSAEQLDETELVSTFETGSFLYKPDEWNAQ